MSGKTPQQRTRDNLTARGYLVGTVEKKKKFPDRKKSPCRACNHQPMIEISSDLWEVFDIVAVKPLVQNPKLVIQKARQLGFTERCQNQLACALTGDIIFVQTTSRANHSTRRNKILSSMEAKLVLLSGARILIQSWRQESGEFSKWKCYDEWITIDMYAQAQNYPNTVAELMEIRRKEKKPEIPPGSTLQYSPVKDKEIPF